MPNLKSRQGLGAQRSAPTASEAQGPWGARQGIPTETGLILLPGRLGSWQRAPGPLPAVQVQGGVHPTGLGGRKGCTAQAR